MTPPEKSQLCTDARSAGGRNLRGYLLKLDSFVYATSYFPLWAGLFRLFPQLPSRSTRIQELNKQFFKMPSSGNVRQCHRQARWAFEWEEPARPRTQLMKSNRKAGSFIRLFSCSAITSESFSVVQFVISVRFVICICRCRVCDQHFSPLASPHLATSDRRRNGLAHSCPLTRCSSASVSRSVKHRALPWAATLRFPHGVIFLNIKKGTKTTVADFQVFHIIMTLRGAELELCAKFTSMTTIPGSAVSGSPHCRKEAARSLSRVKPQETCSAGGNQRRNPALTRGLRFIPRTPGDACQSITEVLLPIIFTF